MTVYSVYEPASDDEDVAARAEKIAFVKDGFSWIALIVPALWLLYHRMWIELIIFLVIIGGLQLAFGNDARGMELAGWVTLAISVLFAFEANDLRGAALQRRGYRFVAVATGADRTEAERSFFTAWLPRQQRPPLSAPPAQKTGAVPQAPAPSRGGDGEEVIGLFPRA